MTQPTNVVWEEVRVGKLEARIDGERVEVSLQSRPVAPGDWQDRWVWESEHYTCGDEHWATANEAMDEAEAALIKPKRSDYAVRLIMSLGIKYAGTDSEHMVEQYISEAEWQDGVGYWDNFKSEADLFADFELFMQALNDAPEAN